MSLLALLLALVLERGMTHLLHLREPRWLDRYLDWTARRLGIGEMVFGVIYVVTISVSISPSHFPP